ncbi:UNVERIFIED_CONTAM: hypothetical protein K2H54_034431 [Gekko kuhli]
MDHIFLVPILVFLHAGFPPASAAEELPPPELSVYPNYPQYYEGESVELTCVSKTNKKVKGYRFFDQNGSVVSKLDIDGFWSSLLYITVQREKAETYSCEYWSGNGTKVPSQRSNTITLQVREAPKKPSLTLNHTLLQYRWGDYVSLVCSAPPEAEEIMEFQYFGDRQTHQVLKQSDNTDIYNLSILEPKDTGSFSCAYIRLLSGRNVRSKMSDPVFINLTGSRWGRILATGGAFFTINGLIFLSTHYYFLPKVS